MISTLWAAGLGAVQISIIILFQSVYLDLLYIHLWQSLGGVLRTQKLRSPLLRTQRRLHLTWARSAFYNKLFVTSTYIHTIACLQHFMTNCLSHTCIYVDTISCLQHFMTNCLPHACIYIHTIACLQHFMTNCLSHACIYIHTIACLQHFMTNCHMYLHTYHCMIATFYIKLFVTYMYIYTYHCMSASNNNNPAQEDVESLQKDLHLCLVETLCGVEYIMHVRQWAWEAKDITGWPIWDSVASKLNPFTVRMSLENDQWKCEIWNVSVFVFCFFLLFSSHWHVKELS